MRNGNLPQMDYSLVTTAWIGSFPAYFVTPNSTKILASFVRRESFNPLFLNLSHLDHDTRLKAKQCVAPGAFDNDARAHGVDLRRFDKQIHFQPAFDTGLLLRVGHFFFFAAQ
jgi:hypothetical protein